MKILCVGGAGAICREAVRDLAKTSDFDRITVADLNEAAVTALASELDDSRVDTRVLDVTDQDAATALMADYDIVMDGTPISMNDAVTQCMVKANVHGINLNGLSTEWSYDEAFKANGKTFVPGFGMTPGTTNLMAMQAADLLEEVDTVRISHGAFRPFAFSEGIAETTCVEYDPRLESRLVYQNGEFVQVPPFSRPLDVELPLPFGTHTQYVIPHPETRTLATSLADKGVRLIEVRGTWPPKNMQLLRALYDWGFLRNDPIPVDGGELGIMDAVARHLCRSEEGTTTELYGYALHVEVTGRSMGRGYGHILTTTHPPSDGSEEGWEGLLAYTKCVGLPLSVGAQFIAAGKSKAAGAVPPEQAFEPGEVFAALAERKIEVHKTVSVLKSR